MKLLEILSQDGIEPELASTDKLGVLRELATRANRVNDAISVDMLAQILMERERLGSTGIGHGVAIPHGKSSEIEQSVVVFGRSMPGVRFDAIDSQPCHLFFMLVAPETSPAGLHLQALARISRLVKDAAFRQGLMEAPDAETLWETIRVEDERV